MRSWRLYKGKYAFVNKTLGKGRVRKINKERHTTVFFTEGLQVRGS